MGGIKAVGDSVKKESGKDFCLDAKYGYIHSCPTNLGTGMRASVHVDLPGWTKYSVDKLKERCEQLHLQPRGTRGESGGQTGHTLDISTLLHGDNSELILFIDPDKEGLGSIVEDTSAFGPVSLHTSNSKVSVSRDEEEVVINKLLSDLIIHASQGVVFTSKITREGSGGILHKVLNTKTLLFGDSGGKTKSVNGTTNPDSGGM